MQAAEQPEKFKDNKDFLQYLYIKLSENGTYSVKVKTEAVAATKKHSCWLLIISNNARNAVEALNIYRSKDVFSKLKHSLDLARLRVHSDTAIQSKVFICLIALVLLSNIHYVIASSGLYKTYTMKLLMKVLSKRLIQNIGD